MSVTICWRQIPENCKHFSGGTSTSWDRIKRTFGETRGGTLLGAGDIPRLRAMAVASDDEFYNEIADIIEKVGAIELWGTW